MLDLGGKVVVPGFIDSHVHFISGGLRVKHIPFSELSFFPILTCFSLFFCLFFSEMIIWECGKFALNV